jgi:hypothetical protein
MLTPQHPSPSWGPTWLAPTAQEKPRHQPAARHGTSGVQVGRASPERQETGCGAALQVPCQAFKQRLSPGRLNLATGFPARRAGGWSQVTLAQQKGLRIPLPCPALMASAHPPPPFPSPHSFQEFRTQSFFMLAHALYPSRRERAFPCPPVCGKGLGTCGHGLPLFPSSGLTLPQHAAG